jgi:hypothetical protein
VPPCRWAKQAHFVSLFSGTSPSCLLLLTSSPPCSPTHPLHFPFPFANTSTTPLVLTQDKHVTMSVNLMPNSEHYTEIPIPSILGMGISGLGWQVPLVPGSLSWVVRKPSVLCWVHHSAHKGILCEQLPHYTQRSAAASHMAIYCGM